MCRYRCRCVVRFSEYKAAELIEWKHMVLTAGADKG